MQSIRIKQSWSAIVALLGLFCADAATAGAGVGTLTYAPLPSTSVPTLSGWMLAVMAMLVAVIAFRVMRAKNVGGRTASVVSAGILALAASTGNQLVSESKAALAFFVSLSVSSGGQVQLAPGENEYRNTSGVTQRITGIAPMVGWHTASPPLNQPECTLQLTILNGASCYINIVADSSGT